VHVWDAETGVAEVTIATGGPVQSLTVGRAGADDAILWLAHDGRTIGAWTKVEGVATMESAERLTALVFSDEGPTRRLAGLGADGRVRFWRDFADNDPIVVDTVTAASLVSLAGDEDRLLGVAAGSALCVFDTYHRRP
jgi:hypothetical protein